MWTNVSISGKAVEVFTPETPTERGAVIYLHGHGAERLSEKPEFTALFKEFGLPVICPWGGPAWWLDLVCEEFDAELTPARFVREGVMAWIQEQFKIVPPRVALLGISMGGQGALNLAYRHARTFPIVAAISPAIDFHIAYGQGFPLDKMFETAEAARQQTATLHVHPLNWPKFQFFACDPLDPTWFTGCERLASKLSSSGLLCEHDLETSLGGHTWEYFTAMARKSLQFISESLERI